MGNLQLVIGNESLPQLPQYSGSGAWAIGRIDKSFHAAATHPKQKPPGMYQRAFVLLLPLLAYPIDPDINPCFRRLNSRSRFRSIDRSLPWRLLLPRRNWQKCPRCGSNTLSKLIPTPHRQKYSQCNRGK
ncbi:MULTISPECIES: hypothetical protein [unclassified Microcoleus]|uniref:hypothetical protein n=1 Tax=unclassified Microcoleus TaxID=2642155 RepID=UPI002FD395D4